MSAVYTAADVARELDYVSTRGKSAGRPRVALVLQMARDGEIPPPIDDTIPTRRWRWSRVEVDTYTRKA